MPELPVPKQTNSERSREIHFHGPASVSHVGAFRSPSHSLDIQGRPLLHDPLHCTDTCVLAQLDVVIHVEFRSRADQEKLIETDAQSFSPLLGSCLEWCHIDPSLPLQLLRTRN
jgi:hypothetical protein